MKSPFVKETPSALPLNPAQSRALRGPVAIRLRNGIKSRQLRDAIKRFRVGAGGGSRQGEVGRADGAAQGNPVRLAQVGAGLDLIHLGRRRAVRNCDRVAGATGKYLIRAENTGLLRYFLESSPA